MLYVGENLGVNQNKFEMLVAFDFGWKNRPQAQTVSISGLPISKFLTLILASFNNFNLLLLKFLKRNVSILSSYRNECE